MCLSVLSSFTIPRSTINELLRAKKGAWSRGEFRRKTLQIDLSQIGYGWRIFTTFSVTTLVARHDCQACGHGIGGEARPLLAAAFSAKARLKLYDS